MVSVGGERSSSESAATESEDEPVVVVAATRTAGVTMRTRSRKENTGKKGESKCEDRIGWVSKSGSGSGSGIHMNPELVAGIRGLSPDSGITVPGPDPA